MGDADFRLDLSDTLLGFAYWSYRSWVRRIYRLHYTKAGQVKSAARIEQIRASVQTTLEAAA